VALETCRGEGLAIRNGGLIVLSPLGIALGGSGQIPISRGCLEVSRVGDVLIVWNKW
jgi:hypothetical protein